MGYGKRALQQLKKYYEGEFTSLSEQDAEDEETGIEEITDEDADLLSEVIKPRKKIPTLLKRLPERAPESLDYLGTSYGLTQELLKFWKSQKFVPVYLSQKENDLTGEHSCIMISTLSRNLQNVESQDWLQLYYVDFRRRILKLLPKSFKKFTTALALSLMDNKHIKIASDEITQGNLDLFFIPHDIKRLESYVKSHSEYRLMLDLTSDLGSLYFQMKFNNANLDALQKVRIFKFYESIFLLLLDFFWRENF